MFWIKSCSVSQLCFWISSSIISIVVQSSWVKGHECPTDYLQGPSRKCSDGLHAVLDEIQTSDQLISAELKRNKTCREWDRANACYQQLMLRCSQDPVAIHRLRLHIGKYVIYSVPCSRRNTITIMSNHSFGECIVSEISTTHTCTDAIETYLKHFITNRNFGGACRVVSSVLRCLHDVRSMIENRCGLEGSEEYTRHFIKPVVEQTRNVVINHCSLPSPYSDYYVTPLSISGSSCNSPSLFLLLFCISFLIFQSITSGGGYSGLLSLHSFKLLTLKLQKVLNIMFACFVMFFSKLRQSAISVITTIRQMMIYQVIIYQMMIYQVIIYQMMIYQVIIFQMIIYQMNLHQPISRSCLGFFVRFKITIRRKSLTFLRKVRNNLASKASRSHERNSILPGVAHFSWKIRVMNYVMNSFHRFFSNLKLISSVITLQETQIKHKNCLKSYHHHHHHHHRHHNFLENFKRQENLSISSCLSKPKNMQYSQVPAIPRSDDSSRLWNAQIIKSKQRVHADLGASVKSSHEENSVTHECTDD